MDEVICGAPTTFQYYGKNRIEPAIAAMHGSHSVFDIGHCMVIHCDAGGVPLVDQ